MAGMLTNGALAGVVNNMPPAGWLSESNIAGQGTPPAFSYADIGGKTGVLKITDQGYRTAMYQIIETNIGTWPCSHPLHVTSLPSPYSLAHRPIFNFCESQQVS
jgi:hypothetical protein